MSYKGDSEYSGKAISLGTVNKLIEQVAKNDFSDAKKKRWRNNQNDEFHTAILPSLLA